MEACSLGRLPRMVAPFGSRLSADLELERTRGIRLFIQPTSVPAERLFSAAGSIVTRKWASLHPKKVDTAVSTHES